MENKPSTGVWIFLSVLLVVVSIGGLYIYTQQTQLANNKATTEQEKKDKEDRGYARDSCLAEADIKYWNYIKLNATDTKQDAEGKTIYSAAPETWDAGKLNRDTAKDDCYKQYPN